MPDISAHPTIQFNFTKRKPAMFQTVMNEFTAYFSPRYAHRIYKTFEYTDRVREVMHERSCSWVVSCIFALQEDESAVKNTAIQHWDVKTLPDGQVLLTCIDRDSGEVVYSDAAYPVRRPVYDCSLVLNGHVLDVRKSN